MAAPMMCDNLDNNVAAMIISNLGNGDTIALCPACIPLWAQAIVAEFAIPDDVQPAGGPEIAAAGETEGVPSGTPFRVVPEAEAAEAEAERADSEGAPPPPDDATADER